MMLLQQSNADFAMTSYLLYIISIVNDLRECCCYSIQSFVMMMWCHGESAAASDAESSGDEVAPSWVLVNGYINIAC